MELINNRYRTVENKFIYLLLKINGLPFQCEFVYNNVLYGLASTLGGHNNYILNRKRNAKYFYS